MENREINASLSYAREAKHSIFLAKKWIASVSYPLRQQVNDTMLRASERIFSYTYDPARYAEEYVVFDMDSGDRRELERVIYCFWTGHNELTPNRRASLASLVQHNETIDIRLITPENLVDYILPDEPLHPAFKHLSLVHRSDYLRCYFMNFWGGGYCDLKRVEDSWLRAFHRLENADEKWALGYREVASDMTARLPGRLGTDVRRHYSLLIGNGAFIMKAQTPLTREWYRRLLDRMDFYAEDLAQYPGNERGENPGYPIPWIDLLGNILAPLALKYHGRLILDDTVRPRFSDYK